MANLLLVLGAGTQLRHPAQARLLYCSPWFCRARKLAEATGVYWRILDAMFGLCEPDQVIAPHLQRPALLSPDLFERWATGIECSLTTLQSADGAVVLLAPPREAAGIFARFPDWLQHANFQARALQAPGQRRAS